MLPDATYAPDLGLEDFAPCTPAERHALRPHSPFSSLRRHLPGADVLRKLVPRLLRLLQLPLVQGKTRRLRVSETVSLGDKRFLSIVQVDGVDYLVGVGSAQVSLLTRLESRSTPDSSFEQVVSEAWQSGERA